MLVFPKVEEKDLTMSRTLAQTRAECQRLVAEEKADIIIILTIISYVSFFLLLLLLLLFYSLLVKPLFYYLQADVNNNTI